MLSERIRVRWIFAQILIQIGHVEHGLAELKAAAANTKRPA